MPSRQSPVPSVRFCPDHVSGHESVTEVAVLPDRVLVMCGDETTEYQFESQERPFSATWVNFWLIRLLNRFGVSIGCEAIGVGEWDWLMEGGRLSFETPLRIAIPRDVSLIERERLFDRIQQVVALKEYCFLNSRGR